MKKYLIFTVREFLGLDNDYETLLENQNTIVSNQASILQNLEKIQENQIQETKSSYMDYITLKNLLWIIIMLGFIGGGFWVYNTDLFSNATLELIKGLSNLSQDLHTINHKGILETLGELNEKTVNLSKEEVKLLLEIKNLLLKKGIDENISLDKPLSELLQPKNDGIVWGDFKED